MTTNDQVTETAAPFASLADLRAEHSSLMRAARREGRGPETVRRVQEFLVRAQAVGRLIDTPADRDSAQGVLDYWTAWLFSSADAAALASTPPMLAPFDASLAPDLAGAEDPYLGLNAFTELDAGRFIGREEAVKTLLDRLRDHALVFVSGPTGSGKTSLVLAGIVPRLKSRLVIEARKEPVVPVMIPGSDPFGALLKVIHAVAANRDLPDQNAWVNQHRKKLEQSPAHLADVLRIAAPDVPAILVIDQFEELFTLCTDQQVRDRFAQTIAAFAPGAESPNRAILIVREDYARPALKLEAFKPFAHEAACFSPPPLTGAELVRVIKSAADNVGLKFDDGIVEDLANQVAGDAASLPTLQFTLSKLWANRAGNRITADVYARVGRPREALRRAADAVYDALGPDEQTVARQVFLELVQPGVGGEVVRRRLRRDQLVHLAPDAPDRVARVLDRFVDAGLIRMTPGTEPDDDRFEVAHEALVHNWKLLDGWVRTKRQESEKKLQLMTTAKLWQESGGNRGYLLTGDAIKAAAVYRDATPALRDLIAASEKAELWANRFRWSAGYLAVFVLGVSAAGAWVLYGQKQSLFLLGEVSDSRDIDIQRYETQLEGARASAARFTSELEQARRTIERQEQQIAELQQRLQVRGNGPQITPVPPPPLPPSPRLGDSTPAPDAKDANGKPTADRGYVWIGSVAQSNLQDLETGKEVSPLAVKPDGRYRIVKNVVLRSGRPKDDYTQTDSLGVVPNGTPITAAGPPIAYTRPSGTAQYWLPARVDASDRPIVYLQFEGTSKSDAHQQFSQSLQERGYRIPAVQSLDAAKGLNEVRYFLPADRAAAERLAADVTRTARERGYKLPETKVADFIAKAGSRNHPGVLELWLDLPASP